MAAGSWLAPNLLCRGSKRCCRKEAGGKKFPCHDFSRGRKLNGEYGVSQSVSNRPSGLMASESAEGAEAVGMASMFLLGILTGGFGWVRGPYDQFKYPI